MDTAAETVERELTILVRSARTYANRAARNLDPRLDSSAYIALTRIADSGPMRAQALACRIGLDKSTVSRLVATLTELGLVERVADPDDRRAFLLRLTAEGSSRVHAARRARRAELRKLLSAWPDDDRTAFARLLATFNGDLQALSTASSTVGGSRRSGRDVDQPGARADPAPMSET